MQANEFTFSIEGKDADVLAKFKKRLRSMTAAMNG